MKPMEACEKLLVDELSIEKKCQPLKTNERLKVSLVEKGTKKKTKDEEHNLGMKKNQKHSKDALWESNHSKKGGNLSWWCYEC